MFGKKKRIIKEQQKQIEKFRGQAFGFAAELEFNDYRDKRRTIERKSLADELAAAQARIDALISHVGPEAGI